MKIVYLILNQTYCLFLSMSMSMLKFVNHKLSFLLIYTFAITSSNADITLSIEKNSAFILITGEIVDGDSERFSQLVNSTKNIVNEGFVVLNSPGGKVAEAINIGEMLRANGFSTAVLDKTDCQSACALIWLAGKKRIATSTSRIGFHQSYTLSQYGTAIPSIQGNALVGYYLAKIDVSPAVVAYVTAATPETFEWLSFTKARELGIDVVALDDEEQTTMGRVTKPKERDTYTKSPKGVAKLPLAQPENIPSYKNIQRAAKNTLNKYRKDGISGLHAASIACWRRVSELGSAKSFQYCFSLYMISAYIDHIVSSDANTKPYDFFTTERFISRQSNAQEFIIDKYNIPNDFVKTWGKIAVDETNKLANNK